MKLTKLEESVINELIKKSELISAELYQQSDTVNDLLHKQFDIKTDDQITLDSAIKTLKNLYDYQEQQGTEIVRLLKHFKGE